MTTYKQQFKQHYKYKSIQTVSELSQKRYIYRYMSLSSFLKCLCTKSIRFNEPSQWPDKFESRFYCAKYKSLDFPRKVFSLCTTEERDCEPSWSIYAKTEPTIQIKINRQKWLCQLNDWSKDKGKDLFEIYEGKVNYDLNEAHIAVIHEPTFKTITGRTQKTAGHSNLFQPFDLDSFLSLLLLKRKAYEYEKEIRYLLVSNQNKKNEETHIDLPIFDLDIIEEIRYSSALSLCDLCKILTIFEGNGWTHKLVNSKKTTLQKDSQEITLCPFDISEGTYIDISYEITINY